MSHLLLTSNIWGMYKQCLHRIFGVYHSDAYIEYLEDITLIVYIQFWGDVQTMFTSNIWGMPPQRLHLIPGGCHTQCLHPLFGGRLKVYTKLIFMR